MSLVKFVACLVCNAIIFSIYAQGVIDYHWKQVPLGGGGYIIGMQVHPDDGTVRYFRTDIGGAYRWNEAKQELEQLIFFGIEKSPYYGVGGIALDPNDADRVILAVGRYCDPNETAILVSNDRGSTWSQEIIPGDSGSNIYFASNGARGCDNSVQDKDRQGSPIVLNPNNPNELFIGSRGTGLWKLNIAAEQFTQIGSPTIPTNVFPNSIRTLEFHPVNSSVLYIAYAGQGIFRGDVNANSYEALNTTADLKEVSDLSISKDGDYMLMACKHKGIYKADLSIAMPSFVKVLDYTGVNRPDDEAFLTVTCSPTVNDFAVTAFSDWAALSTVRTTSNSGNSWTNGLTGQTYDNLYPWHTSGEGSHISQLRFDPDNPTGLYFTSWFTTFYTSNFTANPIQWTNKYSKGHEEAVITDISAFPINTEGNFLGITGGDQTGFLYSSIAEFDFPDDEISENFDNSSEQVKGASIDYCFSNSDHIVISTTKHWDDSVDGNGVVTRENTGNIFHSSNGGKDFFRSTNYDKTLGKSIVAIASNSPQYVVISTQDGLMYSTDYGANFSATANANTDAQTNCTAGNPIPSIGVGNVTSGAINTSVFSGVRPLVGDKVMDCLFYFYNRNDGTFHVSTDYGASFFKVSSGLPTFVGNRWRHKTRVTTIPGKAKHVWINFRDNLYYTIDAGVNWQPVSNVQKAETIAVGKQMGIGTYPTIFLFGRANGDPLFGFYRSIDMGITWDLIHDRADGELFGSVKVMGGDMNVEGRLYFSGGGLGLQYADDASVVGDCDPQNILTNHSFESGFADWQTRTSSPGSASFNTVSTPNASDGTLSAEVAVSSLGNNHWDIQIKSSPISVVAGKAYTLTFDARSLTGTATLKYGSNTVIGNSYVMNDVAGLTNSWQSFAKTFTPTSSGDIYLAYNFGDILGTFYIDNVILSEHCPCPDLDNDTVCDDEDVCPGFDDLADADGDGIPDGCEVAPDCELIENGAFDPSLDPWELRNYSTANGSVSLTASGFAKIEISSVGASNWHLGLRQKGILLQEGKTYEVTYTAYADTPRAIDVIISNSAGSQYSYHSKSLTSSPTTYSYQFTMPTQTNSNAVINMNVGSNMTSVYFDNVGIQDLSCDGCLTDLQLNNHDIYDGVYQVETLIESNGRIILPNQVSFEAAEVLLNPSFEVINSTTFEVVLSPCN